MKKIINENIKIERVEVSREEAAKLFQEMNDRLKLELLEAIPSGESVTLYKQGEFVDLCRGPHLPSTGYLKAFQLTHVSVHIGEVIVITKCFSAYMVLHSLLKN